jgi:hypothetical protein
MASITNSLISTPSTPSHHSPAQRPLKAVLPPITQQQFDQFNNLNTEDIVKKVRKLVRILIIGMAKLHPKANCFIICAYQFIFEHILWIFLIIRR